MVKLDKNQKPKYAGWWDYKWDWLKDQWSHRQLQDWILFAISIIFISLYFICKYTSFHLYHGSYTTKTEQLYLFSAIPQSLAAIFALTFSLLLVAIQHVSSNYTPRAFRLHSISIYYFLFFTIFLYTIGYSIYLNGKFHKYTNSLSNINIDRLELLFFLALAFMVPFSFRAVRLMRPAEIIKRLSWKITERRLNNYSNDSDNVDHFLQSIFDMIKACIEKADLRSIENGLNNFNWRLNTSIRRSVSEKSNKAISTALYQHYLDACYYATEQKSCSGCIAIINSLTSIIGGYEGSRFRSSVKKFFKFIECMVKDIERFNNKIYQDRYIELHSALSILRDKILDITT